MNREHEDRLLELARRTLAQRAEPGEVNELRSLLSGDPTLKETFQQLGAETGLAREVLDLLEDMDARPASPADIPLDRLRKEVFGKVFPSPGKPRDVLALLKQWAGEPAAEEVRRRRAEWLESFRAAFPDPQSANVLPRREPPAAVAALAAERTRNPRREQEKVLTENLARLAKEAAETAHLTRHLAERAERVEAALHACLHELEELRRAGEHEPRR